MRSIFPFSTTSSNRSTRPLPANAIRAILTLFPLLLVLHFTLSAAVEPTHPAGPRGATIQVGAVTWHTEQTPLEKVGEIARRENKPILAFFTATWCGPCQGLKKEVLSKDDFRVVAAQAVPWYIEQTEAKGQELVQRYKIRAFPTLLLLDAEGKITAMNLPRERAGLLTALQAARKGTLPIRGRTIRIGAHDWFTAEVPFTEIQEKARREKKAVLVCILPRDFRPAGGNDYIPTYLLAADFSTVAAKTILYFVNSREYDDTSFWRNPSRRYYPCLQIYAPDGELLEPFFNKEDESNGDFAAWFNQALAGDSYYHLKKQSAERPGDRALLFRLYQRTPIFDPPGRVALLKQIIELHPDTGDEISQKAYEALLFHLPMWLATQGFEEADRRDAAREWSDQVEAAWRAYFPDRFRFDLKGENGVYSLVACFNALERFANAVTCFENWIKDNGQPKLESMPLAFDEVLTAYLGNGQEEKAREWLARLETVAAEKKPNDGLVFRLIRLYETLVRFHGARRERDKAEEYMRRLTAVVANTRLSRQAESIRDRYSLEYGLFAATAVEACRAELQKAANGREAWKIHRRIVTLLHNSGDTPAAVQALAAARQDARVREAYAGEHKANLELETAQVQAKIGTADAATLQSVLTAATGKEDFYSLSTVAEVCATLERWPEAVQWLEKAMGQLKPYQAEYYQRKLLRWKKKIPARS